MLKVPTAFTAVDKYSGTMKRMEKSTRRFANKAQTNFARAERSVRSFNSGVSRVTSKVFNLRNAAVALAATAVFKKMYDGVTAVAELGDEAAKSAAAFGISAEALQEYQFAADRSGVSSSIFESSMLALVKRTGELRAESGGLYTYLNKTGQTALMNQLKAASNTDEAMQILTKRMGEIESPTQRAALANAAFSRSGIKMVNMMKGGVEGINALREEKRKYGVISNEAAAQAEGFMDSQTNMQASIDGILESVGSMLIPKVQLLQDKITSWIGNNKELIKSKVSEWANKISESIQWVVDNSGMLITTGKILIGTLVGLKVAMIAGRIAMVATKAAAIGYNVVLGVQAAMTGGLTKAIATNKVALIAYKTVTAIATAAQWAWNAALNANPIGLIIGAIVLLIGLIAAVIKKWDQWGAAVSLFMGPIGMVIAIVMEFKKRWEDVVSAFKSGGILGALKKIGQVILSAVLAPIEQLLKGVGKIPGMDWATDAANNINQFREGMFDGDGGEEPAPSVNNGTEQFNMMQYQQTNNAKVDIDVNDPNKRTKVKSDQSFVNINTTPTFGG